MFLELSALRASGSVAGPRRPYEQESSFSVQFARASGTTTAGPQRTRDSLAGWFAEERHIRPNVVPPYVAKHLQCGGSPGGTIDEKGMWVGGWVGLESARESLVQTNTPARESSVARLVDTQPGA
jgi:hypothetical protein